MRTNFCPEALTKPVAVLWVALVTLLDRVLDEVLLARVLDDVTTLVEDARVLDDVLVEDATELVDEARVLLVETLKH